MENRTIAKTNYLSLLIRLFFLIKTKGIRFSIKKITAIYFPYLLVRFPAFLGYPQEFEIEPTNFCNFRCPLCSNKSSKRKRGIMSFENFKLMLDRIGVKIKLLNLTLDGEPLINRDIFKMTKYAHENKGIKDVIILTNASLLHTYSYDDILESGISNIIISFDGATKDTFIKYRVGADFDRILENVKDLCNEKIKRQKSKPDGLYPKITLQFLVMKHNEHEIEKIKELAKNVIKPDKLLLKSIALWTNTNQGDRTELAKQWLPKDKKFWRYDAGLNTIGKRESKYLNCSFLFEQTLILWNGDVVLCCMDFEGKYKLGNIFEQPYKEIFRSKKFNELRKKIYLKQFEFCSGCDLLNQSTMGECINYSHD